MKNLKKQLVLASSLSLCMGLSACGTAGSNSTNPNSAGVHTSTYNIKRTDQMTSFVVASATCTKTSINGAAGGISCNGTVPAPLQTMITNGNNAKSYSYTDNNGVTFIATRQ